MNWLHSIISEDILYALGWTLLHALWQGTLLAIVLSAIMFTLNKHAAKTRYGVAVAAHFSMLLIAIATFWFVFPSQGEHALGFMEENSIELDQIEWTPNVTQTTRVEFSSFQERMTYYFESHLPLIVTLWLMGVLVFTLKMLGSLAYIQRLKTYRVKKAEAYWQEKVLILSAQMGIKKVVRLMESAVVRVPMVVGHLKPIILLPVGTITGLSPQQLEAILAHELAHIARHDYLVNILQSIVEIFFFYHPGVWWLSKTIRQERENCCDDVAIAYNHDSLTFAKALTSLQEHHWKQPELSMALGGKKSHLKARIERVLHINNNSSTASLKATFKEGFLTAMLLIFAIIGFSFTLQQVKKENEMKLENDVEIASLETDSSLVENQPMVNTLDADKNTLKKDRKTTEEYPEDEKTKKLSFTLEDDRYVFVRLDSANNIIEMFIEGEKIEEGKFKDYPEVIKAVKKYLKKEKIHNELLEKEKIERERMLKELQAKEQAMQQQISIKMEEKALLRQKMIEQEMAQQKIILEQLEIEKRQNLLRLERETELLEKAVKEGKLSKLEFEERLLEFEKQQLHFKAKEMEKIAELERLQLKKEKFPELRDKERILREKERLVRKQAMLENRITRENVRAQAAEERDKYQKFKQVIFPELLKDGLIKSKSSQLHFKITTDSLEVNCKKQSDKLHKKYFKILKKELDIKLKDSQKFEVSSYGDCN